MSVSRRTFLKGSVASLALAAAGGTAGLAGCSAPSAAASSSSASAQQSAGLEFKLNWEYEPRIYEHFTDLGHYLIKLNDVDYKDFDEARQIINKRREFTKPSCTGTVKRNADGDVLIGHNMDVTISQAPAYVTQIHGGTYETLAFNYNGAMSPYAYEELDLIDSDTDFLTETPYAATDAMNEAGLFIAVNMRETDKDYDFNCYGTNPDKPRSNMLTATALACLNCATVPEAVEFMRDSFSWYTLNFELPSDDLLSTTNVSWNFGFLMGDAQGNYGLVEMAKDNVYFTPYTQGQGNYYVHPELAQYEIAGSGYGRFAKALEGLPDCQTEYDMMDNMKKCMWGVEVLNPGALGFDDFLEDVNERRSLSEEEALQKAKESTGSSADLIRAYYEGDEQPLRNAVSAWTTGFNFGVNCAKKHLVLRLWEKDESIIECQW